MPFVEIKSAELAFVHIHQNYVAVFAEPVRCSGATVFLFNTLTRRHHGRKIRAKTPIVPRHLSWNMTSRTDSGTMASCPEFPPEWLLVWVLGKT